MFAENERASFARENDALNWRTRGMVRVLDLDAGSLLSEPQALTRNAKDSTLLTEQISLSVCYSNRFGSSAKTAAVSRDHLSKKLMPATSITNELMNRAFELAYFILGDRAGAIYVAMAAMDKLKAASTAQVRRLNYIPTGRSAYPATRTKVSLSEIHLLQRLVYIECELFERLLEGQEGSLRHEDLLIRYIKHLTRITTKHNSFYVALGLCRLLYNYTTSETAEIYNFVLQDPVRMRDDHYYRSRKKLLMEEMKGRFGNLIRTQRGFRREERFQTQETTERFKWLVNECLDRFAPWQSSCVLPNELDPKRSSVPSLLFEGGDPDTEHEIELNRMHTLTHPACFARLTTALRVDFPDLRLEIPQFFVSADESRPGADRFNPTRLSDGELNAIKHHLDKSALRRTAYAEGELICLIDHQRMGTFSPTSRDDVHFNIKEGAELVEIRSVVDEEEYPVAIWPIQYGQVGWFASGSTVLAGGQTLSFKLEPPTYDSDVPPSATINISFDRVPVGEKILGRLQSAPHGWRDKLREIAGRRSLRPALAMLIIAVFAIGLWRYLKTSNVTPPLVTPSQDANKENPSSLQPAPSTAQSQANDLNRRNGRPPANPLDSSPRQPLPDGIDETESTEQTRGKRLRPNSTGLMSVKKVYVDSLGDDLFSRQLREELIAALKSNQHFTVVQNREDASAVFKGSTAPGDSPSSLVVLDLIDASGRVIWSFSSGTTGLQFAGPTDASRHILEALLRSRRAAGGQR